MMLNNRAPTRVSESFVCSEHQIPKCYVSGTETTYGDSYVFENSVAQHSDYRGSEIIDQE